jgi:hypothetical protein
MLLVQATLRGFALLRLAKMFSCWYESVQVLKGMIRIAQHKNSVLQSRELQSLRDAHSHIRELSTGIITRWLQRYQTKLLRWAFLSQWVDTVVTGPKNQAGKFRTGLVISCAKVRKLEQQLLRRRFAKWSAGTSTRVGGALWDATKKMTKVLHRGYMSRAKEALGIWRSFSHDDKALAERQICLLLVEALHARLLFCFHHWAKVRVLHEQQAQQFYLLCMRYRTGKTSGAFQRWCESVRGMHSSALTLLRRCQRLQIDQRRTAFVAWTRRVGVGSHVLFNRDDAARLGRFVQTITIRTRSVLLKWFHVWRSCETTRRDAAWAILKAVRRQLLSQLQCAWSGWATATKSSASTELQQTVVRVSQQASASRSLFEVLRGALLGRLARALEHWHAATVGLRMMQRQAGMSAKMKLTRLYHQNTEIAFIHWSSYMKSARQLQQQRTELLRKVVTHMTNAKLILAWEQWRQVAAWKLIVAKEVLIRLQARYESAMQMSFHLWHSFVLEHQSRRRLAQAKEESDALMQVQYYTHYTLYRH